MFVCILGGVNMEFMKLHYSELVNTGEIIKIDEKNLLVGTRKPLIHKEEQEKHAVPSSHKD